MNSWNTLLAAVILVTALAVGIVTFLRRPFLRLLVELCGSEVQGTFWFAFACIAIVLTTLLGALLAFDAHAFEAWRESGALDASLAIFRSGLLALLFALAAVALSAVVSIGNRASSWRPALPPIAPPQS